MKTCPTCDKTFEDSMRFCQVDGTPLVGNAPAFDPYATIVAPHISPIPEPEPMAPEQVATPDSSIHRTVGSIPITEPSDVLDLPSRDPLKTMYVSESEMQAALEKEETAADIIEIPPIGSSSQPEPPSFLTPDPLASFEPAAAPSAPPPSPFAVENFCEEPAAPASYETESSTPMFDDAIAATPVFSEPEPEKFDEAKTVMQPVFASPFEPVPAPVEQWTPPPAPDSSWQNQQIGSNTPFQPPPMGTAGQNKTLAIVSLVAGILGVTICCGGLIPSLVALITGFMARGKANSNPSEYGGSGLAMAGIITGAIGLLGGIVVLIFWGLGMVANLAAR